MQVTATTAAGSPAVFDGLGFDPAHPYYLGTVLAATPPRHIDALQNQVAFTIGANDPTSSLLTAPLYSRRCSLTGVGPAQAPPRPTP